MDKFYYETLSKLETTINELESDNDCFIQQVEAVIHLILEYLSEVKERVLKRGFKNYDGLKMQAAGWSFSGSGTYIFDQGIARRQVSGSNLTRRMNHCSDCKIGYRNLGNGAEFLYPKKTWCSSCFTMIKKVESLETSRAKG